jgi:hypothetical protein
MYIYIYIHRLLTEGREFEGKKHPKEFILGELAVCHQVIYYLCIYLFYFYTYCSLFWVSWPRVTKSNITYFINTNRV